MPILRITVQWLDRRARCANRSRSGASSIPKIEPLCVLFLVILLLGRLTDVFHNDPRLPVRRRPGWRNRFIFKPIVIITCRDRLPRSTGYLFPPRRSWMNVRVLSGAKKRVVLGTILADGSFLFFFYVCNIALRLAKKNFCGFWKRKKKEKLWQIKATRYLKRTVGLWMDWINEWFLEM